MNNPAFAWLDGRIVPWDECVLHARSPGAFWGANVFEGVRAYWNEADQQLYAFRMGDHLARLWRSMKSLHMSVGYAQAELAGACRELLVANDFRQDCHFCVVVYCALGSSYDALNYTTETGVHITAVPVGRKPAYRTGVAAAVSSWRRISDDSMPPRIKTGANYHNGRLAQHEAVRNGYDTTLLLNQRGTVAEAPGSCMIMVRDGCLVTPPATSGVLEGITVDTVERIAAAELGIELSRREIDRTELYVADELFLCGTMSELLPITSVDRIPVGDGEVGPLTRSLQDHYDLAVRGQEGPPEWSTPIRQTEETRA